MAVERVRERVRLGGHDIPEEVIRRRHDACFRNFFTLYQPLADKWYFYDNSGKENKIIAFGKNETTLGFTEEGFWKNINEKYDATDKKRQ